MHTLSPELALVDEELAKAARGLLAPPPYEARTVHPVAPIGPLRPLRRATGRRRFGRIAAMAAIAVVATAIPASLATDEPPLEAMPSTVSEAPVPAVAQSDRGGSTAPGAPLLTPDSRTLAWRGLKDVQLYNVILLRGRRRIDFWSPGNRLVLNDTPESKRVEPGSYSWYVYPGFSAGENVRYGRLLAHGQVVITDRPANVSS